jgi:hypothetical protein
MRLPPLRPFDRVVGGYATLAFALAAGESIAMHEWAIALCVTMLSAMGIALLLHDHRRWRSQRRDSTNQSASETS